MICDPATASCASENGTLASPTIPLTEEWAMPIILIILLLAGVIGNATILLILARHKSMRNAPNILILSLAVSDLIIVLTCTPFRLINYISAHMLESPLGENACKLYLTLNDIAAGASVFTLIALSADRFLAIARPLSRMTSSMNGNNVPRCTLIIVALIWLVAAVLGLPATLTILKRRRRPVGSLVFCQPYPIDTFFGRSYPKWILLLKFLIFYAIPLILIAYFYISIAWYLLTSVRNVPGEKNPGQIEQINKRKQVARTVLVLVVLFAICFFPQHIPTLWTIFFENTSMLHGEAEGHNDDVRNAWVYFFCPSMIDSCVNPVALYCMSGQFRNYYNRYLLPRCWITPKVPRCLASKQTEPTKALQGSADKWSNGRSTGATTTLTSVSSSCSSDGDSKLKVQW